MLSSVANDFRLASRRLLAAPLFSAFAVVSLAIGIGVTTIAHSIVDDLFFGGVSVADPARVALVGTQQSGKAFALTLQDFDALQSTSPSFSTLTGTSSFTAAVGTDEGPTELLLIEAVAPDYFSTIGVMPAAGRLIQTPDETSHAPVAVVSHAYWQRKLGPPDGEYASVAEFSKSLESCRRPTEDFRSPDVDVRQPSGFLLPRP